MSGVGRLPPDDAAADLVDVGQPTFFGGLWRVATGELQGVIGGRRPALGVVQHMVEGRRGAGDVARLDQRAAGAWHQPPTAPTSYATTGAPRPKTSMRTTPKASL